jgi:alpha-1,3-mannosyltransferase
MEEVEGYLLGERDYTKLQGGTGPLVYPAGFLYVFSILRSITENGTNILSAQIVFIGVYILNLLSVLVLYVQGDSTVSVILTTVLLLSKRVHSIYMLRMFNDCIAVLLGYLAIICFTRGRFRFGCLLYSFGVSIKMNMLLHAPGILLVLLMATGYMETVVCLSICAGLQLAVGYPFLSTYPVQYLTKSFELGRVFMHKWTVNFKFLPEDVFVAKELSILLLVATIIGEFQLSWLEILCVF